MLLRRSWGLAISLAFRKLKLLMGDANALCYCRCVIKPHVHYIKWHQPQKKHFKLWERLINRKNFKVTANTRVCSNHFVHGRPLGEHPHPELWLRGYETDKETNNHEVRRIIESWNDAEEQSDVFLTTRTGAVKRKAVHTQTSSMKSKKLEVLPKGLDNEKKAAVSQSSITQAAESDHTYCNLNDCTFQISEGDECSCQFALCVKCKRKVMQIIEENENLRNENAKLKESLDSVRQNNSSDNFSIDKIKDSDYLVKLHTGLDNFKVFEWIYNQVKDKVPYMQYYKGSESHNVKRYQVTKCKKPGPERILSPENENELLLTLMKLRLNLNSQFLGFTFTKMLLRSLTALKCLSNDHH